MDNPIYYHTPECAVWSSSNKPPAACTCRGIDPAALIGAGISYNLASRSTVKLSMALGNPCLEPTADQTFEDALMEFAIEKLATTEKALAETESRLVEVADAAPPGAVYWHDKYLTAQQWLDSPEAYEVLQLMPWMTAPIAHLLVKDGHKIPAKCEEEQAYVMRWCLNFVISHGAGWRDAAIAETKLIKERLMEESK